MAETKFYEDFFIPKPEATGSTIPDEDGKGSFPAYRAADGKLLRWSATFPLPEIGQRIYITMNGIGWAVVKGYFDSVGYLGVMTLPTRPPKWMRDQHKRDQKNGRNRPDWFWDGIGCEFGAEIELKKPKAKNNTAAS